MLLNCWGQEKADLQTLKDALGQVQSAITGVQDSMSAYTNIYVPPRRIQRTPVQQVPDNTGTGGSGDGIEEKNTGDGTGAGSVSEGTEGNSGTGDNSGKTEGGAGKIGGNTGQPGGDTGGDAGSGDTSSDGGSVTTQP